MTLLEILKSPGATMWATLMKLMNKLRKVNSIKSTFYLIELRSKSDVNDSVALKPYSHLLLSQVTIKIKALTYK